MAASPKFKVYDASGKYQASCKEPEAAAALVSFYGDGSTVRLEHAARFTVWTEGREHSGVAAASYDDAAATMMDREFVIRKEASARNAQKASRQTA